ncbi:MAG: SRPBCC family protein [Candidatus Dormiibacterota bacterium]
MPEETVSATRRINASPEALFAVLADPSSHAAIDGTGWVREAPDAQRLNVSGQVFRMAMYHDNHPDKHYEMSNQVQVFDPPRAIAWKPGYVSSPTGELAFGGWIWRYDLIPISSGSTDVTLSYDWSAVAPVLREHIQFPPFPPDHLQNSLDHLAALVGDRGRGEIRQPS